MPASRPGLPAPSVRNRNAGPTLVLAAGDVTALFVFSYVGVQAHDLAQAGNTAETVLLTLGEFAVAWLVAGWLAGAFAIDQGDDEGRPASVRGFLRRSLIAWLAAAPLGALVRALVLERAVIPTPFLAVTLGVGGALVLSWRLLFFVVWRRINQRQGTA